MVETKFTLVCMQNGNMYHMGVLRAKDVLLCPVNAVAMLLVYRFVVNGEEMPHFDTWEPIVKDDNGYYVSGGPCVW